MAVMRCLFPYAATELSASDPTPNVSSRFRFSRNNLGWSVPYTYLHLRIDMVVA